MVTGSGKGGFGMLDCVAEVSGDDLAVGHLKELFAKADSNTNGRPDRSRALPVAFPKNRTKQLTAP